MNFPRLVPPAAETIIPLPATFVDYFRVRVDPQKSGETDRMLRFGFTGGRSAGLHVRRAVAEFIAAPGTCHRRPDVSLAMSESTWVSL